MYFPPLRRMRIRRGGPPLPIPVGTMRRQWIQWPRIQSSWIREGTPADANTQDQSRTRTDRQRDIERTCDIWSCGTRSCRSTRMPHWFRRRPRHSRPPTRGRMVTATTSVGAMRMLDGVACGGPAQAVPAAASGNSQSCGTYGACIMRRRAIATARAQPAAPAPLHRARRPATSTGAPTPTPLHRAIRASPPRPQLATGRCCLRLLHRRQRWQAWPVADRTPGSGAGC